MQSQSNETLIPQFEESTVPAYKAKRRADLLTSVQRLLDEVTPALCESVFRNCRHTERERKWSFYAIVQFWMAMIVQRPRAIEHELSETRKGRGRNKVWPRVMANARAFYNKAAKLRPHLFETLYEAFLCRVLPQAPCAYASWLGSIRAKFPDVLAVDGSRLDAVCHTIKILRSVRARILPGCVTVFYDLFRGVARKVLYFPDAAAAELPRARHILRQFVQGTLLLGDRLYASVRYFYLLSSLKLYGLFRRNKRITLRRRKVLSHKTASRTLLEDILVHAGCGQNCPNNFHRPNCFQDWQRQPSTIATAG